MHPTSQPEQDATHHSHQDHRTHYYKVLTYPNAQLSESDMQEFPAPPRATQHSQPSIIQSFSHSIHPRTILVFPCSISLPPWIHTLFTILSSIIRSICPNHLKAHLSALPDRSTCTPTLLLTLY